VNSGAKIWTMISKKGPNAWENIFLRRLFKMRNYGIFAQLVKYLYHQRHGIVIIVTRASSDGIIIVSLLWDVLEKRTTATFWDFLFYLSVGCSLSAFFSTIYNVYFLDTVWWMFLVKCFVPFYSIFYDFNIITLLSGVTIAGQITAWGIFIYYMYLAFRGQTVADWSKARSKPKPLQGPTFSYQNFKEFLGPYPFLRILNPFHPVICKSIGTKQGTEDSDKRKGFWPRCRGNCLTFQITHDL